MYIYILYLFVYLITHCIYQIRLRARRPKNRCSFAYTDKIFLSSLDRPDRIWGKQNVVLMDTGAPTRRVMCR